jgi:Na+-transporting NADH:ubiquinone oxidoreductase subunit C
MGEDNNKTNNQNNNNEEQEKQTGNEEQETQDEKKEKSGKEKKGELKGRLKEGIFTVVFMFVITFIFISALTLVHSVTRDRIEFNEEISLRRSILYAAGVENVPTSANKLEILKADEENGIYEIGILRNGNEETYRIEEVRSDNKLEYFEVYDGSSFISYVYRPTGPGLWGEIVTLIGFSEDLETISGIDFVQQNETPGLGARITEKWFREQFKGKLGPRNFDSDDEELYTTVGEDDSAGDAEFSAITGASVTSNAVKKIVNKTILEAREDLIKDN